MDSIPAFPIFAPVEEVEHSDLIKHRHFFEDISDYNYTSLVIWGHQTPFFVSKIGNNLFVDSFIFAKNSTANFRVISSSLSS